MKLSIITININHIDGLQKTAESIVLQTFKDFEWIVIDGGSTDGSKDLIKQYSETITYWVSEPDKGIYNAMNKGIMASHGEYLLFMNSGDRLYDQDVLAHTVPFLQGIDFYVGGQYCSGIIRKPDLSTIGKICNTLTFGFIPHQSTFIRRTVFEVYGLYCEELKVVSDWWLFYNSILLSNATIEHLPFIVSDFEENGISSSTLEMEERHYLLSTKPRIQHLVHSYINNKELVDAIKGTHWFFFIFRVYYFFYRKWKQK